jgi:hypothetical protein
VQVAQPHRRLSRKRTRHRLADGKPLLELGFGEPMAVLNEVALHVADQRDGTTEAGAAESQEVPDQRT